MKKTLLVSALALLALGALVPAQSAPQCGKRADFLKQLDAKYQESVKAMAIAGQVNLVEVFTSKKGTWTILVTTPEGKTCIIAAGDSWQDLKPTITGTSI